MPYARNSIDGTRVHFEDDGGGGAPVVFFGGLVDSVQAVRVSPIAQALPVDRFRLVYVDHRGVGRSDKPHEPAAHAIRLRVADAVSVLDAMGDWSGPGDEGPEESITFSTGKLTDDQKPEDEGKAD
jgi:pimeloyl-ACP methyl ester carboxylesterase